MGNSRGFTLIEVLIVVALLALLSAIAIPGFSSWVANYRLRGVANDLYNYMQRARSEAVKRNTNVGIAFTTVAFPATGGSVLVFVDDGAGGGTVGNAIQDGAELTLLQATISAPCSLYSASFSGNPRTGYNARGLPLGNRVGSVDIRNDRSRWYRVSLSNAGYLRVQKSADGIFD